MQVKDSLSETIQLLRTRAQELRERSRRPYPSELRSDILHCVSELRATGLPLSQCAVQFGISAYTLRAWLQASKSGQSSALLPVSIVSESPQSTNTGSAPGLILRMPSGCELRGLSLSDAIEALRVLR